MFKLFGKSKQADADTRTEPTIGNLMEGETATSSDRVRMFELFGDPMTSAGAVVTDKTAMRVSAVYSCVSLIAGSIAQLPLPIFERVDGARNRVDHEYWWILNEQFCSAWSATSAWEFLVTQMLLRGDGIAYIVRNRAGRMTDIIPWPRSRVDILEQPRSNPKTPKRLQYTFHDDKGYFTVDQDDALHFPGFGFNGVESMSVIQWGARNGIGIAIRGDEHAGQFFSEGGKPEIAVKVPGEMSPAQQEDFRNAWVSRYGGVDGNRRRKVPLVLTEGLSIEELTMSAIDQQLLESRQWQVVDIARSFGVPPHMIGETSKSTSWGSGIEQMYIGFVRNTLGPHLKRFKDELNRKLFRTARTFTEHNVEGFLAGDSKTQAMYFGKALGGPGARGWMFPNEVRRIMNLPPVEGGDTLYEPTAAAPQGVDEGLDDDRKKDDDENA